MFNYHNMKEPYTCKDCENILFNIVGKCYCGQLSIHNNPNTKNKELNQFIEKGVIPNWCPIKDNDKI